MKKLSPVFALLSVFVLLAVFAHIAPVAHAAFNEAPITDIFVKIRDLINQVVVPLIFAIAFIVFLWGVFQYFIAGGAQEEKRDEGKKFVMYALIGFAVMVSVWGLVNLLVTTFGFDSTTRPCLPTFDGGCVGGTGAAH